MTKYKVLQAVEIGNKIRQVGETVDQSEMQKGFGKEPSEAELQGNPEPWAPNEWDSLEKTGHIKRI